MKDRNKLF